MASSSSSQPAWANPNAPVSPSQQDIGNDILLEPYSTLEEPVLETIMRDVRAVGSKLKVVMLPLDREAPFGYTGVESSEELGTNQKKVIESLKDWDLWCVQYGVYKMSFC
jgi:hypothetical protein